MDEGTDHDRKLLSLLKQACELPEPERRLFLERACGDDAGFQARVAELLENVNSSPSANWDENLLAAASLVARSSLRPTSPSQDEQDEIHRLREVGGRSIVMSLDGEARAGVKLDDLEEEGPLPELKQGSSRYAVLEKLGEGGMGIVYLVYDQDLKRRVALKMIGKLSADGTRRFLEEAQVMGQLQHPSIVPLLDVGLTEAGKLYYTMPVVRGRTLGAILKGLREGHAKLESAYSMARLMQVFVQTAQAVGYAHAKGVLHRDLKPDNVMLGEHGEVQVLDWGLSKVLKGGSVQTDLERPQTSEGRLVGTPAYMAPEQALGAELDERTDVYALGVMLYEMLTLERLYTGPTPKVLEALILQEPKPPRQRAPQRNIPLVLEAVSLAALQKDRSKRPGSADELAARVQEWLEAEADKARRRELAGVRAEEGRQKFADYRRLKQEVSRLEVEAEETRKRFEPWQPVTEKRPLFEAEDALRAAQKKLVELSSEVVTTLTAALEQGAEHAGAREALADFYWDRFADAEASQDEETRDFYERLVARYHDGRYARELQGDGSLTLTSEPQEAEVWLHELVEEGFVLVERNAHRLGPTPVGPLPLPMGSYLVILKKEGYHDVRYPVFISRNRLWTGKVNLYAEDEIGKGMIYVPAGPFIQGGDEGARGWSLPRSEPWVDDFFIAEHPVTMEEYLEFLNDLARTAGIEAAEKRAPRPALDAPAYLVRDGESLTLPEVDADGDRWDAAMPVFGISWHDAVAYCGWRAAREGKEYRLPAEAEREKAARGVDGRWYPWGNRFDPSLCNMNESQRKRPAPVPVDEFPGDLSVYGVRGTAGNVRDWTATERVEGEGANARVARVVRGGAWLMYRISARCASRVWSGPMDVSELIGLRLALRARRTR